jgi:beta-aspartyl-dipeptidase (metallo-type)
VVKKLLTLIKDAEVYSPSYEGKKDVLIGGGKILYIQENIKLDTNLQVDIVDGEGYLLVPGFIDSHVHIVGGGGEGGYNTRTPEITLSQIVKGGITTLVGVLGTDNATRSMENLIAKAKSLNVEGITCYAYTGSYHLPLKTFNKRIIDDIVFIEEIIGVGEIAISDHRGSQPTIEELTRLTSDARVGGILSKKAGIVNVHVGRGKNFVDPLIEVVKKSDLPIKQFLPTHMNKGKESIQICKEFIELGGRVDFTTSSSEKKSKDDFSKPSKALKTLLDEEVNIENISFSSDGQGSLPKFDEKGNFLRLDVADVCTLFEEVRDCVIQENIPLEEALKVITSNPANFLKLENKGQIKEGFDADLVLLQKDTLNIEKVMAKGKLLTTLF